MNLCEMSINNSRIHNKYQQVPLRFGLPDGDVCVSQQSMQNLNQKMASLAMKNDQLQRLEADDQLNRLSALPRETSEVCR